MSHTHAVTQSTPRTESTSPRFGADFPRVTANPAK
jgi:hypothetical protein